MTKRTDKKHYMRTMVKTFCRCPLSEKELLILDLRYSGKTFESISEFMGRSKGEVSCCFYRAEEKAIKILKSIIEAVEAIK